MESVWKDEKEICPPRALLGTFIAALTRNLEAKGQEHRARLIEACHPNLFVSIPKIHGFIWDAIMARHPKSLATCMLIDVEENAKIFAMTMHEIFGLPSLPGIGS